MKSAIHFSSMFKHCMVARGSIPLAEYPTNEVELHEKSMKFLTKLDTSSPHSVMEQNNLLFTAATENEGISFVCCCDRNVETKNVGLFLNNLKSQWIQAYGAASSTFNMNEKSNEFGVIMKELIDHFNEKSKQIPNNNNVNVVPAVESIHEPLNTNDESDELIETNPFPLQESPPQEISDDFHSDESLTALKLKVFWQRNKVTILIVAAVIFLVLFIIIISKL